MLLTRRTLFLLLLAAPLIGASALAPSLLTVAVGYIVPAEKLTVAVINKYLELKGGTLL